MPNTHATVEAAQEDAANPVANVAKCEEMSIDVDTVEVLQSPPVDVISSPEVIAVDVVVPDVVVQMQEAGGDGVIRTVQTQHGDYRTVDEENIVVLVRCLSPQLLNLDEESVWIQTDALGRDPVEVSSI